MTKWKLAYQTNCWGPMGGDAVGVTSVSRLTYRTYADMARAIDEIASAGFTGVEMFDGNLLDYQDRMATLRQLLERAGVQLVAAYSGCNFIFPDMLAEELARLERVAAATAEAGGLYLVVGGGAQRASGIAPGDYALLADALDQVAALASKHGLSAHYHPHLSTIVETPDQVRKIFSQTSIGFCPDTAHLAAGGADVPALLTELRDRITYVHMKGWQREPFRFTPLDEGDLDTTAILNTLEKLNFEGWIAAELDEWADPLAGAKRTRAFFRGFESAGQR
jgi:inosose dehydratase